MDHQAEANKQYTAKEIQELLGITYSALRNKVNTGEIKSVTPPGKRQAVYILESNGRQKEKDHYTAKEAEELLGMTYSALRNQVDAGNIHSFTPPGKKQEVYSKNDVDQLKEEMELWLLGRRLPKPSPSTFSKATKEDMPECVALSAAIFGGVNIIPLETRIAWLEKNPEIDYVLRHGGEMMGYVTIIPLKPDILGPLFKDELLAKDIAPEEIEEFRPGKPLTVYIMAMGVKPRLSKLEKRTYAARLVKGTRDVIVNLGRKGVTIETILARSEVPDGINILRHMGFTEIPSDVPGTRNFIIETEKSGIPSVMEYKRELELWKQKQISQARHK